MEYKSPPTLEEIEEGPLDQPTGAGGAAGGAHGSAGGDSAEGRRQRVLQIERGLNNAEAEAAIARAQSAHELYAQFEKEVVAEKEKHTHAQNEIDRLDEGGLLDKNTAAGGRRFDREIKN